MPTFAALLTALGLATAAAVFWWTRPESPNEPLPVTIPRTSPSVTPSVEPSAEPTTDPSPTTPPRPAVRRGKVEVTVLNATTVVGLAGKVTTQAAQAGWRTQEPGNTGTQPPGNTVFYSGDLKQAAKLLAKDLGISRVAETPAGFPGGLVVVLVSPL